MSDLKPEEEGPNGRYFIRFSPTSQLPNKIQLPYPATSTDAEMARLFEQAQQDPTGKNDAAHLEKLATLIEPPAVTKPKKPTF